MTKSVRTMSTLAKNDRASRAVDTAVTVAPSRVNVCARTSRPSSSYSTTRILTAASVRGVGEPTASRRGSHITDEPTALGRRPRGLDLAAGGIMARRRTNMENVKLSLCPMCDQCPEVEVAGDEVRIGEADNLVVLKRAEWNVLVDLIQSGQLAQL
jgi:hypothetical protein